MVFQDEKINRTYNINCINFNKFVFASAAEVSSKLAPCYASDESRAVVENLMGDIFTKVQNDFGYANARVKSNVIIFNARLNRQTNGYSYDELVDVVNAAIWRV